MNSLYEKRGNDGFLWSEARTFNAVCYENNYFPKRKFKLCFTQRTLFLSIRLFSIANMFAVRYPWEN